MRIGGEDTVIDGPLAEGEAMFIVASLSETWSDLVVQDAESDSAVSARDTSIAAMREFFVYRSRADFESWNRDGASEDNRCTMIHVVLGDDSTTVVADAGDGGLAARLAKDIRGFKSRAV